MALQMSNTRCELINYLLYPLFAAVALSLALPGVLGLGLAFELSLLYGLSAAATAVHLHYGACVVRQMCEHLRIEAFRIPNGDKYGEHRSARQAVCVPGEIGVGRSAMSASGFHEKTFYSPIKIA